MPRAGRNCHVIKGQKKGQTWPDTGAYDIVREALSRGLLNCKVML